MNLLFGINSTLSNNIDKKCKVVSSSKREIQTNSICAVRPSHGGEESSAIGARRDTRDHGENGRKTLINGLYLLRNVW